MAAETRTTLQFLVLLGHMSSLESLISLARIRLRPIQRYLADHWTHDRDLQTLIPVSADLILALLWWLDRDNLCQGTNIQQSLPQHLLFTDASMSVWGAHMQSLEAQGCWSGDERAWHINALELRAVWLGLRAFLSSVQKSTVVAMTDNTTVVAYIRNQGGTHSRQLSDMAGEMLLWADVHGIELQARHVPGRLNCRADQLSRAGSLLPGEWSLNPHVCCWLWRIFGKPLVDLFATRNNNRLDLFFSSVTDDLAVGVDGLSQTWNGLQAYAYPPTPLITSILSKIDSSIDLTVILIAPNWPAQLWFPLLLDLLVERPRVLPLIPALLKQGSSYHAETERLQLHAWMLSSDPLRRRDFLREQPVADNEVSFGRSSVAGSPIGIVRGRLISSLPLPMS